MKLDVDPFPIDVINFEERRVLVRTDQATTNEGKRVVVSDELRQNAEAKESGTRCMEG
jgi:hypothetical protein